MEQKPNILFVDDETKLLDIVKISLSDEYNIFVAKNGLEAKTIIQSQPLDLVITDIRMPDMDGKQLLEWLKKEYPFLPIIFITAYGTIEDAVEAVKNGVFDYIVKPVKIDQLRHIINKALNYYKLVHENTELKAKLKKYERPFEIVTADPEMKKILELAKQVAKTDANVLITGETGTGKQLLAEYIHYHSDVANGPFVEINAGAIPHELLESELFGYEKGAFTGAVQTKKGKFELANNGTLFLDEIGELPLDLQVKLLHAVERKKITRVGGTKEIPVNVRLITATNRDLKKEIQNKNFRSDLYYRISVVTLKLPPLRERKGDIPILINYFLEKHNPNKNIKYKVDDQAMQILLNYSWPGNIRELENVIHQAIIFAKNGVITKSHLPAEIVNQSFDIPLSKEQFQELKKQQTEKIISKLEQQYLTKLLTYTKGNISRAAEISGYNRRQLQNLLAKHNINPKNFK